ncbi:unnamed protein product [Periconia digitata]|uniref:Uncharacterized protein n=1 Tax=Periconia digitata TaxID=1303443 RepID=A0A9W4USC5_9PLEO|nr:unnamed protein product [Periconia digitata]
MYLGSKNHRKAMRYTCPHFQTPQPMITAFSQCSSPCSLYFPYIKLQRHLEIGVR